MKFIELMKITDHVQIGHLYEHIFIAQLAALLKDTGYFAYSDYDLSGMTYRWGLMTIEIKIYDGSASDMEIIESFVRSFKPTFDNNSIDGALLQMMAEKIQDVDRLDPQILLEKLYEYDQQEWLDSEYVDVINVSKQRLTTKGLTLKDKSRRQFLNLKQTIAIDPNNIEQDKLRRLPAFYVLTAILENNLREVIQDTTFCYSIEDSDKYRKGNYSSTNIYRIDRRQASSITTELQATKELVAQMRSSKMFDRLVVFLKNSTYLEPYKSVEVERILEESGIMFGLGYWRNSADIELLDDVFNHMTISYSLGQSKKTVSLKSTV